MRLYFALITCALVLAAICGVALSWDGSYYLFATLDNQTPYVPHDRLSDLLFNWPALAASHLTDNFTIIRLVFNFSYILVPLAALVASWLIVRKTAPSLFVWAALAIGLATLPGQISLIGEGIQVAQLGWPILLATLVRLPGRQVPMVVAFVALVFVAHPTGSAVLGFSALVAAIIGCHYPEVRRKMWGWAVGLAILAVLRFLLVYTDPYDTGQMNLSTQTNAYNSSVAGLPLYALLFVWSAAIALFLSPRGRLAGNRAFARTLEVYGDVRNLDLEASGDRSTKVSEFLRFYGYIGVLVAGVVLVVWASNPHSWKGALDFKGWVLVCSLPFMIFAALEGILHPAGWADSARRGFSNYRKGLIMLSGGVYLAVFGTQSLVFAHLTSQLQQDIRADVSGCIPIYGEGELSDSLFTHWSVSSLALVLQSREPHTVVLDTFTCDNVLHYGRIQLISWDPSSYSTKWFNLGLVPSRLSVPMKSQTPLAVASPTRAAAASLTLFATASPTPSPTLSPRSTATESTTPVRTVSPPPPATVSTKIPGKVLSSFSLSPSWLPSTQPTQMCQFRLTQGWYAPERVISGSWQWSKGEGYIRVTATRAMRVILNVGLVAAMPQDTINVVLNGKRVATRLAGTAGPAPISPVALQLRAGGNLLILRSVRSAVTLPNEARPLAMAAVDFTLSLTPTGPVCASPEYDLPPVSVKALQSLPSSVCTYAMSYGWYDIEQSTQSWWRWTSGVGEVQVTTRHSLSLTMTGYIASIHVPDLVDVLVDGRIVTAIPVHINIGYEAFDPVVLHLQSGVNTITFHSRNAPGHTKGDSRNRATAIYDLQIGSKENVPICALRS